MIATREQELDTLHDALIHKSNTRFYDEYKDHNLFKIKNKLDITLAEMEIRRSSIATEWAKQYQGFSWWNKFKHPETLDLSELDDAIGDIKELKAKFITEHSNDLTQ